MEVFSFCYFCPIRKEHQYRVTVIFLVVYLQRGDPPAQSYFGSCRITRIPF